MCSIRRLCDFRPEDVSWIWPGRLAVGELSFIEGPPGVGKSTLIIDLIARTTTGRAMPDGSVTTPSGVILITGEDDPSTAILPRLISAGGDPEKVSVSSDLRLPGDLEILVETAKEIQALLVIVDSLSAHIDSSTASEQAMRRDLMRLRGSQTTSEL